MSIENHPNFHAVRFATDIMASYHESLRGDASSKNCPDIQDLILEFVSKVEDRVDEKVK